MDLAHDHDELQRWANYRWLRKTLRAGGIGSIIFGALAVIGGASGVGKDLVDALLFSIGMFLLLEGIWIVNAPTPAGVAVDGFALLILGAFNIGSTILDMKTGESGHGMRGFILLGVWQIMWGMQSFARYKTFSKLPMAKPPKDKLRWLDSLARLIGKTGTAKASDVIAYSVHEGKKQLSVQALLSRDAAIVAMDSGRRLLFVRKGDLDISSRGSAGVGTFQSMSFSAGDMVGTGVISDESFARYEAWKRGTVTEGPAPEIGRLADQVRWDMVEQPRQVKAIDLTAVKFAGFWRRFAASMLDTLVIAAGLGAVLLITLFVMFMVLPEDVKDLPPKWDAALGPIMWAAAIILPWLYYALMESSGKQASLGKLAMKMAVTDHEGKKISFWRATSRHVSKFISGILLFTGYLMAAFTERKQALHDLMAGALIIDRRSEQ
jgi:uncharacterized RDD family membrane protein YckC